MAPKSNLAAPTSASKMTRSGSKVATNGVAKRPAPAPKSAVPSVKADNRKGVRISAARKKTSSKVSSAEAAAQTSPVLVTSPMQLVQLNSQLRQASGDNAAVSDPSQIAQKRLFAGWSKTSTKSPCVVVSPVAEKAISIPRARKQALMEVREKLRGSEGVSRPFGLGINVFRELFGSYPSFSLHALKVSAILPETKHGVPYAQLERFQNFRHPATHFVVHAWDTPPLELLCGMEEVERHYPNSIFWLELVEVDWHRDADQGCVWWCNLLAALFFLIRCTLIVLHPIENPSILKRCWCLYELSLLLRLGLPPPIIFPVHKSIRRREIRFSSAIAFNPEHQTILRRYLCDKLSSPQLLDLLRAR
jgi:hypothetical protein